MRLLLGQRCLAEMVSLTRYSGSSTHATGPQTLLPVAGTPTSAWETSATDATSHGA